MPIYPDLETFAALQTQCRRLEAENERLREIEVAAREFIENCGWYVQRLDRSGEYEIDGSLLIDLAAALERKP